MDNCTEKIVDAIRPLCLELLKPDDITPTLPTKKVITKEDYDEIKAIVGREHQVVCLLEILSRKWTDTGYPVCDFVGLLKEKNYRRIGEIMSQKYTEMEEKSKIRDHGVDVSVQTEYYCPQPVVTVESGTQTINESPLSAKRKDTAVLTQTVDASTETDSTLTMICVECGKLLHQRSRLGNTLSLIENCSNLQPLYELERKWFIWSDEFLNSVPYDYVLPDSPEKQYADWRYEGNGQNVRKFLNIYRNDTKAPVEVNISVTSEEWVPVTLYRNQIQKMKFLYVYTHKKLLEESEKNLVDFLANLFQLLPQLVIFSINSYGQSVPKLESLWNQLPDSIGTISVMCLPLSESGINAIVVAMIQKERLNTLWIDYDDNSWESLLSLLHQVNNLKKITCLTVTDSMSGGGCDQFVKYLEEINQWKVDLEELHFQQFSLSEVHLVALLQFIRTMKSVKNLVLVGMKVENQYIETLREECGRNKISFEALGCSPP